MLYYVQGTRNLVVTSLTDSEQLPLTRNWCSSCTYSQIWQAKSPCAYKKVSWLNLITVQQDATYSVYYSSVGSSTCFGR